MVNKIYKTEHNANEEKSALKGIILKDNVKELDILLFLNKVKEQNGFEEFEVYSDGNLLLADINRKRYENELNNLLADIETYRILNNKYYSHSDDKDIIGLNYLVEIVKNYFNTIVMYNHEEECFFIA